MSISCLIGTILVYYFNKFIYRKWPVLIFMPLLFTPLVMILIVIFISIPWNTYITETHWLMWLMGPATLAFAVPVFENINIIRKHWLSITAGVVTAVIVAVSSSIFLARMLSLPDLIQRSLAVRSITTPFAMSAAQIIGGEADLAALFVVITGVFGFAIGELVFVILSVKSGHAIGAGFGAASHGAGAAKSYQLGSHQGVIASLVMMLTGIVIVLGSPLIKIVFFN